MSAVLGPDRIHGKRDLLPGLRWDSGSKVRNVHDGIHPLQSHISHNYVRGGVDAALSVNQVCGWFNHYVCNRISYCDIECNTFSLCDIVQDFSILDNIFCKFYVKTGFKGLTFCVKFHIMKSVPQYGILRE